MQLAEAVDAAEEVWTIDTMPTSPYLEVEDELVEIRARYPEHIYQPTQELIAPKIRVRRGFAGTTAASHADTTTLTPAYGASAGGGEGGAIAVTDGITTVENVTEIQSVRVVEASPGVAIIKPVIVAEDDPGAIGPGMLWLWKQPDGNSWQLYVRNDDDDGWYAAGAGSISENAALGIGDTQQVGWYHTPAGTFIGYEVVDRLIQLVTWDADGNATTKLQLTPTDIRIFGIPTADPVLVGALWIDVAAGRVLKVSAG